LRYFDIETVSFNDKNGRVVPVKDIRPIPEQAENFEIKIKSGDLLDEIASRTNIYGEGSEDQAYKIFDANIIEIFESGFDLSKIRRLRIPL
jgi:hypothetical protein